MRVRLTGHFGDLTLLSLTYLIERRSLSKKCGLGKMSLTSVFAPFHALLAEQDRSGVSLPAHPMQSLRRRSITLGSSITGTCSLATRDETAAAASVHRGVNDAVRPPALDRNCCCATLAHTLLADILIIISANQERHSPEKEQGRRTGHLRCLRYESSAEAKHWPD
jgi:hypothetical protein